MTIRFEGQDYSVDEYTGVRDLLSAMLDSGAVGQFCMVSGLLLASLASGVPRTEQERTDAAQTLERWWDFFRQRYHMNQMGYSLGADAVQAWASYWLGANAAREIEIEAVQGGTR